MLGKTTAPSTQSYEAVVPTAVVEIFLAGSAGSIVNDRLDANPVTGLVFGDALPNFFDGSTELVSHGQRHCFPSDRVRCGRTKIWTAQVLVEVCAMSIRARRITRHTYRFHICQPMQAES
jgi:hypothetical protein